MFWRFFLVNFTIFTVALCATIKREKLVFIAPNIKNLSNAYFDTKEVLDIAPIAELHGDTTWDLGEDKPISKADKAVYIGNLWKCGRCTVVNEDNFVEVYNDSYQINASDGLVPQIMVEVQLKDMRCVTINAPAPPATRVTLVYGTCFMSHAIFNVYNASSFTVRAYAEK